MQILAWFHLAVVVVALTFSFKYQFILDPSSINIQFRIKTDE